MPVIRCDTRTCYWNEGGGRKGSFRPGGRIMPIALQIKPNEGSEECAECDEARSKNPVAWDSSEPVNAARLFVGFNVGGPPKWSVNDLIPIVRKVREAQGAHPDASFLIQKGIYTSERTGQVVQEDGAQVIVLDVASEEDFRKHIIELGEHIARDLEQEVVIVEFQKGGLTRETMGVTA